MSKTRYTGRGPQVFDALYLLSCRSMAIPRQDTAKLSGPPVSWLGFELGTSWILHANVHGTHTHIHTYTYLCIDTGCVDVSTHKIAQEYYVTYMHTYVHTYIPTYIDTYVHIYIRTYIHTYIHTYLNTQHKTTHTYTDIKISRHTTTIFFS